MVMQPEYSSSLLPPNTTSPPRKRRRDEYQTPQLSGGGVGAVDEWLDDTPVNTTIPSVRHHSHTHHHHFTPSFKFPSSATAAIKLKQSSRGATAPPSSTNRSSPRYKRPKPASPTSSPFAAAAAASAISRSRSPSPYKNSQEMHLSPEITHTTLPNRITPTASQRCHICSRLQLATFSASAISNCEQCDKPTCGICTRVCARCDENVCGKCGVEVGDYTYCRPCRKVIEKNANFKR
ncbi:hypothetical protein BDZ91DRAFT_123590 [Kalaharituber pfeilii]|nr:hypothetical protein BDZ91DRAFT_123590 [Kalaharituber pfeilii]